MTFRSDNNKLQKKKKIGEKVYILAKMSEIMIQNECFN